MVTQEARASRADILQSSGGCCEGVEFEPVPSCQTRGFAPFLSPHAPYNRLYALYVVGKLTVLTKVATGRGLPTERRPFVGVVTDSGRGPNGRQMNSKSSSVNCPLRSTSTWRSLSGLCSHHVTASACVEGSICLNRSGSNRTGRFFAAARRR